MSKKSENTGFECQECGKEVLPVTNGSYRNHCPFCLYSMHLDILPGDRKEACRGLMEPIGLRQSSKRLQLTHQCMRCDAIRVNKLAENTVQPDEIDAIIALIRHLKRD